MDKANKTKMIRRTVDVAMCILLLLLMAYQVTGEVLHEWIGVLMTVLVIVHQILNRRWYGALFKGKYNPYRIVTTILNIALVASFLLTAFCGMSMSGHAVPFLYGMAPVSFVRVMHLSMSHWSFVLMGLHLGMHVPAMTASMKIKEKGKIAVAVICCVLAGIGLYLFLRNGMADYLFFRVVFAFLDYEKAGGLVLTENLLMLFFWVFAGAEIAFLLRHAAQKTEAKKNPLLPVVLMMAAILIGTILRLALAQESSGNTFGNAQWNAGQEETTEDRDAQGEETVEVRDVQENAEGENDMKEETDAMNTDQTEANADEQSPQMPPEEVEDGYVLIEGGRFTMGSPETENWRIEDETAHEVRVSPFYIDPYETTGQAYASLFGSDPSVFSGDDLPVTNITWLDAIRFANAKSEDAGLTPVYTIDGGTVTWDRSANGYRLPTEAEWEYACRAGTVTPFNTEKSLDATEANFYGHYPYEIEENYFNNSVLEAKPGEYRQTTVTVGSFAPNAWGLYDMHGNVNEWCWDFYGAYEEAGTDNPTGAATGTRHVYRGGGWNDFAKNMRSAYRAAGQEDLASYNLGVRLVRNAESGVSETVTAQLQNVPSGSGGKVLIAYFSWGGNTRGVAREIETQTGADVFEIAPLDPYSSDYNTVLMEAQEDQHNQARPELSGHVENMEEYDIILLGYPNWWASIPMPIASFLEEYDFSGKTIIPFCSHGGGRFGQSLTAIAKLAPDAVMGEGLSVHYSGGASLPDDVAAWLKENGVD